MCLENDPELADFENVLHKIFDKVRKEDPEFFDKLMNDEIEKPTSESDAETTDESNTDDESIALDEFLKNSGLQRFFDSVEKGFNAHLQHKVPISDDLESGESCDEKEFLVPVMHLVMTRTKACSAENAVRKLEGLVNSNEIFLPFDCAVSIDDDINCIKLLSHGFRTYGSENPPVFFDIDNPEESRAN